MRRGQLDRTTVLIALSVAAASPRPRANEASPKRTNVSDSARRILGGHELQKIDHQHLSAAVHEGKVILAGITANGTIEYRVRNDGYENASAVPPVIEGDATAAWSDASRWSPWRPLPLPDGSDDDPSVHAHELRTSVRNDQPAGWPAMYLARSLYDTAAATAPVSARLVSAFGHLYTFRRSVFGGILVDRFVLDALTNQLVRKLDVRYKRSRQRHEPLRPTDRSRNATFDSLDFTDVEGRPFYEPTLELSLLGTYGDEGASFSVVLLSTDRPDVVQWHFFVVTGQRTVEATSIASTSEGLFGLGDRPNRPAIHRQVVQVADDLVGPIDSSRYDVQRETSTRSGRQLLRDSTRVLLTLPTSQGIVACTWPALADGRLAILGESSDTPLRRTTRQVALPADTLDRVETVARVAHPGGRIVGAHRDERGAAVLSVITEHTVDAAAGGSVATRGVPTIEGVHEAHQVVVGVLAQPTSAGSTSIEIAGVSTPAVGAGTRLLLVGEHREVGCTVVEVPASGGFTVSPVPRDIEAGAKVVLADAFDVVGGSDDLGAWELDTEDVVEDYPGLITGLESRDGGVLRVHAFDHRVGDGEMVTISGELVPATGGITRHTDTELTLDVPWQGQVVVGLDRNEPRRPGILLEGNGRIRIDDGGELLAGSAVTIETWVRTNTSGVILARCGERGIGQRRFRLEVDADGEILVSPQSGSSGHRSRSVVADDAWHHLAVVDDGDHVRLFVDGNEDPLDRMWARVPAGAQSGEQVTLGGPTAPTPEPPPDIPYLLIGDVVDDTAHDNAWNGQIRGAQDLATRAQRRRSCCASVGPAARQRGRPRRVLATHRVLGGRHGTHHARHDAGRAPRRRARHGVDTRTCDARAIR